MELRHLRYFVVVAEERNFSRAADRLHMAQPPLSQQIRNLEEEIGVQLIDRNERPIRLTEAGAELFEHAKALLKRLEDTVATVQGIGRGRIGSIRVGFVGSATYDILPQIFRQFREQYPDVQLSLVELQTRPQIEQLRHREIDIGFVRSAVDDDAFESQRILEESLMVALPEHHRLANLAEISLASLAGEPFIGFSAVSGGYAHDVLKVCEEAGFRPNIVQETFEMQTAISLVSAGVGLTLTPASVQRVGRIGVVFLPLTAPAPKTSLYAICRKGSRSGTVSAFLNVMNGFLSSQQN